MRSAAVLVFAVATLAGTMLVRAQDLPSGQPDFSGTWVLDTHLTDNPAQVNREIEIDTGQNAGDDLFGGAGRGRSAFGRPGDGRGRGGERGPSGGGAGREPLNPADRKKLDELTEAVRFASPTLTIAESEEEVAITTSRGSVETLHPNGKTDKRALEAGPVDRVAMWEGPTLVVAYDVGHAGTLTYTYLLVPTTKQLLIRVNFERVRGNPGPFDIKLVYDRTVPTR